MSNQAAAKDMVIIGLGANLDSPMEMMRESLRKLAARPGLVLKAVSPVYLTEPQGGPKNQNWYHNAVVLLDCSLKPHELLNMLLAVELDLGRQRLEYCGPRVIDLDFLAWGSLVINDAPELIIPHPRMHQRLFVIAPLARVAPKWRHPVLGRTAAEILAEINPDGQGIRQLDTNEPLAQGLL